LRREFIVAFKKGFSDVRASFLPGIFIDRDERLAPGIITASWEVLYRRPS